MQFVDVLGVTVVVSTLPKMLSDLRADATAGSLVATAYAMFFGGLLLMGARFGDRYGHRQVLLAGLGVFAVGAVAGAAATSLTVLVIARCVQGAAAALSVPAALTLLVAVTPDG
ncbi:MAG: MFS transporter, partial [Actinomycetota bacterium]|nr:MFS transporter [Actinomycetota bacterium]